MEEAITKPVKYVFLDVVRFATNRSVEAQTEIISILNRIVTTTLADLAMSLENIVFLPTGDGMCIAMLDQNLSFDAHITVAAQILGMVNEHNTSNSDAMRKFEIRIGVNENVDNLVVDINGSKNVAGAGINMAQRIMSVADGGQIMVGQLVFETLSQRERYMKSFERYEASAKHGKKLTVYQLIETGHPGLNTDTPSRFVERVAQERKLTLREAYYLAYAIQKREFLIARRDHGQFSYSAIVFLWYLARDAEERDKCKEFESPTLKLHGEGDVGDEEVLKFYNSVDFWVCCDLAHYIRRDMGEIYKYLESSAKDISQFYIVNRRGIQKLKEEYPAIYKRFCADVV